MRISEISVRGLFGVFDHVIPMNMVDRITIIHGPNGFGKTAILRLMDGLFNTRYFELKTIPFKEFAVKFDNGKTLTVEKAHLEGGAAAGEVQIALRYDAGSGDA